MVSAHCPRCGSPLDLPEPVVQRIELVGGDAVREAMSGNVVRYLRTDLMVSYESTTVEHTCPNAMADRHHAFDTNDVALLDPTREDLR